MRWDPYVHVDDDGFEDFWRARAGQSKKDPLLILGRGFDMRTLQAARKLVSYGMQPDVWLLAFDNGFPDSARRLELTQANVTALEALVGRPRIREIAVRLGDAKDGTDTSRNVMRIIAENDDCRQYDEIVVDISAMPRLVGLTVIAKLLHDLDEEQFRHERSVNLHVVTAESVAADLGGSRGTLRETVTHVVGFSGKLDMQTSEDWPRVWFPVLGEGQGQRLETIRQHVRPDEICPVLPFPSRDPRRGDRIIEQHRETLFDNFRVEPANILLASEYNPFEAYRQIYTAIERYRTSLAPLGGTKAFVTPLSSKLLSVGVLLACYDHKKQGYGIEVGIPYVETAIYDDPEQEDQEAIELHSMWIRGDWEN